MTLKEKSKEHGYTLTKLSEESKVSITYLSRLNTGTYSNPSLDILEKISDTLGITLDELKDSLKN